MTNIINIPAEPGQKPVHVLIVVVGRYLPQTRPLSGASDFAQKIVNFWRAPERKFPGDEVLATVDVLVSDPDIGSPRIIYGNAQNVVDAPSYQSVNHALQEWVNRINATEGAVGFLHWVGHGTQQLTDGGQAVVLYCDGVAGKETRQAGLNWTTTLHWLNDQVRDHRVYCFIDACRLHGDLTWRYPGMGEFDLMAPQKALVFMSAERNSKAFWVLDPKPAAAKAGLKKYAMGTNAFLQGLDGFGARHVADSDEMPIASAELLEAAAALMRRWAAHQQLEIGVPEGPGTADSRPILMTMHPRSTVDVRIRSTPQAKSCDAQMAQQIFGAETNTAPFQFRLARKPHRFRLDGSAWGKETLLVHPHEDLHDRDNH